MPQLGLKPIGFLDRIRSPPAGDGGSVLPVLGASWDLDDVVREHGVQTRDHRLLDRAQPRAPAARSAAARSSGIAVSTVPRLYELTTNRLTVEHLGGLPLVSAHPVNPRGLQFAVKYVADRFVSATLIVLLSPILLAAALATYSVARPADLLPPAAGRP